MPRDVSGTDRLIHALDDSEKIAAKRRLNMRLAEILLVDAVTALGKGKTRVTRDHIERAIDLLQDRE